MIKFSISFLLQCILVSMIYGQNVGIGTSSPHAKLDIHGDMILQSTVLTIPDGTIYQLDVNTNKFNQYKLVGPTSNFQIAGITAAEHDRTAALYNRSGSSMEVYNDDVNTFPDDRILTGTGGTFAVYNGGNVVLKYDTLIAKWEIISSHYNSLDNFGSSWLGNANDIYNSNSGNVGIGTNMPLEKLAVVGNVDITGDIKMSGVSGQAGEVLQNNGNGTMTWAPMSNAQNGDVGYGTWGCGVDNVTEFQPVVTSNTGSSSFGSSVDLKGSRTIIGAPLSTINGLANRGAAYVYVFDGTNWIEQQKITANDGIAQDEFGNAVAINDNWAVVAASKADNSGFTNNGAVYIFNFNGTEWVQTQKIVDNNGHNSNNFGWSVSIDATHIAIGDISENSDQGAVRIYSFDGSLWTFEVQVNPIGGESSDNFGNAVSIENNDLIVGSEADDNSFQSQGSVYFFQFAGNQWWQINKFYDQSPILNGRFGRNVSISGNQAIAGSVLDRLQFYKYENGLWVQSRYFSVIGSTNVSISGNYAISSTGRIMKSTPQSWVQYESVNDPSGTAENSVFVNVSIDNGRFVMCAPSALSSAGIAVFGKIKD